MAKLNWKSEYQRATSRRATLQDGEFTKQQMLQYTNCIQGFTISVFLPILLPNKIVQRIKQHTIYNDKVTTLHIMSVLIYVSLVLYWLGGTLAESDWWLAGMVAASDCWPAGPEVAPACRPA